MSWNVARPLSFPRRCSCLSGCSLQRFALDQIFGPLIFQNRARRQVEHETVLRSIETMRLSLVDPSIKESLRPSSPPSCLPSGEEDVEEIDRIRGLETLQRSFTPASRSQQAQYQFSARFFNKIFTLVISRSFGNWEPHIKTNNIVSGDAEIFRYCSDLDIDGVRRLIKAGRASPLDVCVNYRGALITTLEVRCRTQD